MNSKQFGRHLCSDFDKDSLSMQPLRNLCFNNPAEMNLLHCFLASCLSFGLLCTPCIRRKNMSIFSGCPKSACGFKEYPSEQTCRTYEPAALGMCQKKGTNGWESGFRVPGVRTYSSCFGNDKLRCNFFLALFLIGWYFNIFWSSVVARNCYKADWVRNIVFVCNLLFSMNIILFIGVDFDETFELTLCFIICNS